MSYKHNYMFKYGLLVFTVLLVLVTSQAPSDPYEKLNAHWFYKCGNETKSTQAFDKLRNDAVSFKSYLTYAVQFIPQEKNVFCNKERAALLMRMGEVAADMKPCLSKNEKFMSEFVNKTFAEFLHFLCHNSGENIDTFFNPNAAECRNKLLNTTNPQLGSCSSKFLKPTSGQLSRNQLCGDLKVVKSCFADTLSQECPSYGAYKKLNEEFFKYVSKPCSGCAFYLNSFLLIVSVLASYLFSH